jgi:hypothetical protein
VEDLKVELAGVGFVGRAAPSLVLGCQSNLAVGAAAYAVVVQVDVT